MGLSKVNARQAAEKVMKLETAMAAGSRKRADTRDPLKNYNKYNGDKIETDDPRFRLDRFFECAGLSNVDSVMSAAGIFNRYEWSPEIIPAGCLEKLS